MELATINDKNEIVELYRYVIETVNKTSVKLGWDINIYPNDEFVENTINNKEMCIIRENGKIVGVAVVNNNVNKEYDDIDWEVKGPKEKVATIHALMVSPETRGKVISDKFLTAIEEHCKKLGNTAIHLDVIDTNIPAYKLYMRNNYKEKACIKMYYEVVGVREFWMLEKVL